MCVVCLCVKKRRKISFTRNPTKKTKKTSKRKKFLSIVKFNLMTLTQNLDFVALGGINKSNYKKLKLTKIVGFASINWIKKNGLKNIRPF